MADAAVRTPRPTLRGQLPTFIGKYEYLRTLAEGSSSTVALVLHSITSDVYACKIVSRELLADEERLQVFDRELRVMAALDHPHIVHLHEIVFLPEYICIVMDYCSNGDLYDFVASSGRVSERQSRRFLAQLVDALQYLHRRGICHRDIKLENILLDENMNVKLADFGLCNTHSLVSTACGSPCYLAPEITSRAPYDGTKVDIWSLGIVLFALVAGMLPWPMSAGPDFCANARPAQIKFPAAFTYGLRSLISRMLEIDPAMRPTIDEVARAAWLEPAAAPLDSERGASVLTLPRLRGWLSDRGTIQLTNCRLPKAASGARTINGALRRCASKIISWILNVGTFL